MVFQILMANQVIEIHSLCREVFCLTKEYRVELENPLPAAFVCTMSDEDIIKELHRVRRLREQGDHSYPSIVGESYLECIAVYRKIAEKMPFYDTFLMHGSVVGWNGKAYMFAAPSGAGKTTRTRLWMKEFPGSVVINGDKPLIRITDKAAIACGTPWCGKEGWNTNISLPLQAVFLVERAEPGEENTVQELNFSEAFPALTKQTHRPEDPQAVMRTLRLIKAMDGRVRFYRLHSAPVAEAVRMACRAASG